MKKVIYLFLLVTGLFFASCTDESEEINVENTEFSTDGSEDDDDPATVNG